MNNHSSRSNLIQRRRGLSFTGLALAAVVGVFMATGSAAVHAQSTSGTIFGKVPAGDTVTATNISNGLQREVTADSEGRYKLRALPVGIYNMVLESNGKPVLQRLNVPVKVGGGIKVDFDCSNNKCAAQ